MKGSESDNWKLKQLSSTHISDEAAGGIKPWTLWLAGQCPATELILPSLTSAFSERILTPYTFVHERFMFFQGSHETLEIKFNDFSMTFQDQISDFPWPIPRQDSPNFLWEIHYWTISDTTMSVTTFRKQIRVKLTIFQDHFRSWNFCKFFTRNSSLDNFGNHHTWLYFECELG